MVFARYRFALEHPDDFAPATVSGARDRGFVQLHADRDRAILLKWWPTSRSRGPDRRTLIETNLKRAFPARRGEPSSIRIEERGDLIRYEASSPAAGGFLSVGSGKTYLFCATARTATQARNLVDGLIESFDGDLASDRWASFGLDVTTPGRLRVADQRFFSGRTWIHLIAPGVRVRLERWALAKQILDRHELDAWAAANLRFRNATVRELPVGVELDRTSPFGRRRALVRLDAPRNEIAIIDARYRKETWRPEWTWFAA